MTQAMVQATITKEVNKMTKYNVTAIQFFKYENHRQVSEFGDFETDVSYSANVVINNEFMIQVSGDKDEFNYSIPAGDEAFWNNKEKQTEIALSSDLKEIITQIEDAGFENNIFYLEAHGELM